MIVPNVSNVSFTKSIFHRIAVDPKNRKVIVNNDIHFFEIIGESGDSESSQATHSASSASHKTKKRKKRGEFSRRGKKTKKNLQQSINTKSKMNYKCTNFIKVKVLPVCQLIILDQKFI